MSCMLKKKIAFVSKHNSNHEKQVIFYLLFKVLFIDYTDPECSIEKIDRCKIHLQQK